MPEQDTADWFVIAAGREQGPVSVATIRRYIADGRITATTKVRRADLPQPVAAGKVPSFFPSDGGSAIDITLDPGSLRAPTPVPAPADPTPRPTGATVSIAARLVAEVLEVLSVTGPLGLGLLFGVVMYALPFTLLGATWALVWIAATQAAMGGGLGHRVLGLSVQAAAGGRAPVWRALVRSAPIILVIAGAILLHIAWCGTTPPPDKPLNMDRPSPGMYWDHLPTRDLPLMTPGLMLAAAGLLWWLGAIVAASAGLPFMDRLAGVNLAPRKTRSTGDTASRRRHTGTATIARKSTEGGAAPPVAPAQAIATPRPPAAIATPRPTGRTTKPATTRIPQRPQPATRPLLPILKPSDWPRREARFAMRLLPLDQPQVPWVVLGTFHDDGVEYLTEATASSRPAADLVAGTLAALRSREDRAAWVESLVGRTGTPSQVLMRTGDDLTASDICDPQFLRDLQKRLGGGPIVLGIPVRSTMLAAAQADAARVAALVAEQYQQSRKAGDEVISAALFLARDGVVRSASR